MPRCRVYWHNVRPGHGITRDHEPESTGNQRYIIKGMMFARLFIAKLFMAAMAVCLFQIGKTGNTRGIKPNLFLLFNS